MDTRQISGRGDVSARSVFASPIPAVRFIDTESPGFNRPQGEASPRGSAAPTSSGTGAFEGRVTFAMDYSDDETEEILANAALRVALDEADANVADGDLADRDDLAP